MKNNRLIIFAFSSVDVYLLSLAATNVQPNILFKKNPAKSRIFDS
jgi:hypothetical protein